MNRFKQAAFAVVVFALFSGCTASGGSSESGGETGRLFEMRIYTTHDGKLDDLHRRFRDHTVHLFEKHGMTNIGYWIPRDPETADNTLIYIVSHRDRESADKSWADFRADPVWQQAYEASRENGAIVREVESIYLDAVDYSPMK